ncbi:hypothetical protein IEQ34_022500 [Dendrobium chrysotoxum]|uniref:RING-type E3 ubiquitin transferase n=1 Tax=Dendrobium chrysotoxum TaxID=161865 RepID=A0AAV7FZ79_DENCH|nr:hypothetical protein IEQ34_022500 [Dendrobium chrysotoxum]
MSQCMNRKTSRGIGYSTMGSRLNGKTSSLQDESNRCSNHLRCSAGLGSTDNIAKFKTSTTFSANGLSIDHQNPLPALVNQSLPQKRAIAKKINGKMKTDVSKCTLNQVGTAYAQSSPRIPKSNEFSSCLKAVNSETLQNLLEDRTGVLESSSAILSKGTRKQIKQRPGSRNFYAPTISSTLRLIASRDTKKAIKSSSPGSGAGANKCNLKNNSCSSISEVIPSGCSHSISVQSRRGTLATRIYVEGESSASRTRSTSASSTRKLSVPLSSRLSNVTTLKASNTSNRSKINDHLMVVKPLEDSRRGTTRGLPAKGNPRLSLRESMVAQVPATKFSDLGTAGSFSRSLDSELSSTCHNVSGRKNCIRRSAPGRPTSSSALGSMLTLYDPSANTDAHSYNNTEGLVEHMLESESNLSMGRLHCDDQHREMRMDIDNMSYEELLELVEKIGSVSTGLTDEALTNCLKRSNFQLARSSFGITSCVEDGNRCSICQEECADGDDIGALACEHWYHVVCIQQWLKQKNWCPICKSPACANS